MLYREIIAICSQIHTKHINTLCGQNVELLNVKQSELPKGSYYALYIMLFTLTLLRSWRINNCWDVGNIACVAQGWQHRSQ
jgi:hypothetical protein